MRSHILIMILTWSFYIVGRTQNIEWVKTFGSEQYENLGLVKSNSNNLTLLLQTWDTEIPYQNAKLKFADDSLFSKQLYASWMIKLDSHLNWIHGFQLFEPSTVSIDYVVDPFNNYYLVFNLNRNDSISLATSHEKFICPSGLQNRMFLLKLNSEGNLLWFRSYDNISVELQNPLKLKGQNLLFKIRSMISGPIYLGSDTLKKKNRESFLIVDTSGSMRKVIKLEELNGRLSIVPNYYYTDSSLILFVDCYDTAIQYYQNKFVIKNPNYTLLKIELDLDANHGLSVTKVFESQTSNSTRNTIQLDKEKFLIGGQINGDISFGNGASLNVKDNTPFLLILNGSDVTHAKTYQRIDTNLYYYSGQFEEFCLQGDFFVAGGYLNGKHKILDRVTTNRDGGYWYCKFDTLLNELWYFRTSDTMYSINSSILYSKELNRLYLFGDFDDRTNLGGYILNSVAKSKDIFVAKIHDFSITRGSVRSGPYCAGDSILIPFTKDGDFNTENEFVAELSDENGLFEGRQRELGRIKTNKDSIVKGLLPLFDVVSSKNYRIRILSTSPRVQSYYRYDTLRLLIYSKDTANAGRDTTICYGGVTQLSTTGGSKWRWSPGHLVEDSTARITYTKSITDSTLFRIIISDSSGCGKTDTAYKMLRTYKPLQILNSDTTLCKKGSVLTAKVQGGQPLLYPYVYRWYNDQGKLISKHHSLNTDTMHLSKLQLVVSDNCSGQNDSQWIQINDYPQPQLQLPQDTVVCHAQLYRLRIKAEGGKYPLVCWLANNKDTILLGHELDSTFLPSNGQAIKLIAHDDCSELSDTAEMKITVLLPLNAKLALTPDCYKDTVKLSANCSGGKRTSYQTQWYNESMQILGSDSFLNYSSKGNQNHIIFQLSDACSPVFKDTITLTPMLSAKLQVNKDEQCLAGNLFEFKVEVDTLNNNFMSQKVQIPSNDVVRSGLNYSASFKDTGHYKVQLKVQSKSNQCVDSTEQMVYVRPQPLIHVNWIRSTDSYDSSRWRFSASANVPMRSYLWLIDQFPAQTDDTIWQNFHYEGRVKIHVTGTDVYGCIEDSTYWFDMVHRMRFYIPNAVTDNGDGINDDFYIPGSEYMQEYRIKIFNRWGEKVFDSYDPQEHFKPEFDTGSVYIYTLTIFDIYNERHLLKGVFEVLR